ncbi:MULTISPECIES: invasion associated locus B family protein [Cupriavidus]
MKRQWRLACAAAVAALAGTAAVAEIARADAVLPGGASSLRESYGDWLVSCAVAGQGKEARKVCAMTQEQKDAKSGQRIVAMELRTVSGASVATLFLPFGLDLAAGAALQIDEGAKGPPLPFRTCLPAGCIVTSSLEARMLSSMRGATSLKVHAKADGGRDMIFPISLSGFGNALDRTAALAR